MDYEIVQSGESRSFPDGDAFLVNSKPASDVVIYLGGQHRDDASKTAVLIELDVECLGVHTGEDSGSEGSNVLGFARFIRADDEPSNLIELVRQPETSETAIDAARAVFEAAGFEVAICSDQAGRIIDRLVRPKYNDALRFLDEGLASAEAMDLTCRLGLGYPDGPITAVTRSGLARHHDVTGALFAVSGKAGYAPARRAQVAKARSDKAEGEC